MGQPDLREQPGGIERVGIKPGELGQHVAGPLVAGKPGPLQHHPDALGQRLVVGDRVEAVHPHPARRGPPVPLAALDRRGFAGPVGAEDGGDSTKVGGEREAVDGDELAVADGEVIDLHSGCHDRRRYRRPVVGRQSVGSWKRAKNSHMASDASRFMVVGPMMAPS